MSGCTFGSSVQARDRSNTGAWVTVLQGHSGPKESGKSKPTAAEAHHDAMVAGHRLDPSTRDRSHMVPCTRVELQAPSRPQHTAWLSACGRCCGPPPPVPRGSTWQMALLFACEPGQTAVSVSTPRLHFLSPNELSALALRTWRIVTGLSQIGGWCLGATKATAS